MNVLEIVYLVIGNAAVLCFAASLAVHILLQFYIDHEKVERDTGEPGWKVLGSMMASPEFYKRHAVWLWKIRRRGFIGFFVAGGLIAAVALIAGAFGIRPE